MAVAAAQQQSQMRDRVLRCESDDDDGAGDGDSDDDADDEERRLKMNIYNDHERGAPRKIHVSAPPFHNLLAPNIDAAWIVIDQINRF